MNITTQTLFLLFLTLAASLVLTQLINRVRRWRQRQRDEEQIREAEYEDALRKSQTQNQTKVEPAQPAASTPEPAEPATEPAATVPSPEPQTVGTTSPAESETPAEPGVIQADRFMAWSPPEADVASSHRRTRLIR